MIGWEDQLSSAYQRARYKVSLDKGNATLPLRAATNHFEKKNVRLFLSASFFELGLTAISSFRKMPVLLHFIPGG